MTEIILSGLAYGGDAFGRDADGKMIFVPFALPGERVKVEIVEAHQRWARGQLIEVIEASSDRVDPRCRHFTDCGGCHYQHMPYTVQLQAKAEIVQSQLERIGGLKDPPIEKVVPSPTAWNTRNHLQFNLTSEGHLGFMAAGSHRIVPIEECHLPEPVLSDLWPRLDVDRIPGLDRIGLRSGAMGTCMIMLEGTGAPAMEVTIDLPASVVWLAPDGLLVLAGERSLDFEISGCTFVVSADSFFQVHTALAEELVRLVTRELNVQSGETILDLYAGVGLFSAFLAHEGARIIAVEESSRACSDFEVNLEDFDDIELYEAPVEAALPAIHGRPDAVVIDPPRAGLSQVALQHIIDLSPPRLVYVSCDPATLARDGSRLAEAGYQFVRCTPIDLFPQTFHIETVSLWQR
ncbi:MAG TPA: class I SAM-dependent RNA methyltransferase [Anaerolineae bacterium]|nr:class I SAM-dependent RNA methyltransferase [Anaerolineae bacterium]